MTVYRATSAKSPPAVWAAFVRQAAWQTWVIILQFAVLVVLALTLLREVRRPPEFVVVDGVTGDAVLARSSPSTDALLAFLAERTRPPKVAVARFARDFLHLVLAINSTTVEAAWRDALAMMAPNLRTKLAAEAQTRGTIDSYRTAGRLTDVTFESLTILDQTKDLVAVRAVLRRTVRPLVERATSALPSSSDRVQADLVLGLTRPTLDKPEGLEVVEWRLAELPDVPPPTAPTPPPGSPPAAAAAGAGHSQEVPHG